MKIIKDAIAYADMIKIGHTLFALPFALAGLALAWANGYTLSLFQIFMLLIAFSTARAAAMGFNRVVDRDIDALNPRTSSRPTANGKISISSAKFWTFSCSLLFIISSFLINNLCGILSFPALLILLGYSYTKRFTSLAHIWLGMAISIAPTAAWIAASGNLDIRIIALSFALLFQIAGFDVIYAIQDMDFDKSQKLHSIPSRFGRKKSIVIAGILLIFSFLFLIVNGLGFGLGNLYFVSSLIIAMGYTFAIYAVLKFGEKSIADIFFYINAGSSLLLLLGTLSIFIKL